MSPCASPPHFLSPISRLSRGFNNLIIHYEKTLCRVIAVGSLKVYYDWFLDALNCLLQVLISVSATDVGVVIILELNAYRVARLYRSAWCILSHINNPLKANLNFFSLLLLPNMRSTSLAQCYCVFPHIVRCRCLVLRLLRCIFKTLTTPTPNVYQPSPTL